MATCLQAITAALTTGVGSIPLLTNGVNYNFTLTTTPRLYRMIVSNTDTYNFHIALTQLTGSTTNVGFTIYEYDSTLNSVNVLAFSNIVNSTETISISLDPKTYIICLKSNNGTYDCNFDATSEGFVVSKKFQFDFYHGQYTSVKLEAKHINTYPCTKPLHFEIVEGELPEGIYMDTAGRLYGTIPEMDCVADNNDLGPSFNWYGTFLGEWHPIGRVYRFKVRVRFLKDNGSYDEQWMCIKVHNNWDLDRKTFEDNLDLFTKNFEFFNSGNNQTTPTQEQQTNMELVSDCSSCESNTLNTLQMIRLPENFDFVSIDAFVVWWLDYSKRNKETLSPAINEFLEKLEQSEIVQQIIARIIETKPAYELTEQERTVLNLKTIDGFLQVTSSKMVDGRNTYDTDYMLLENAKKQNQNMPFEFVAFDGSTAWI